MIIRADALTALRKLPAEKINCIVTSPPYWGLRDYGIEPVVFGGDPGCAHQWGENAAAAPMTGGLNESSESRNLRADETVVTNPKGAFCLACGAWRGSLGLEPTPELYVEHLVEIMDECYRVLRPDGTLWLDIGDCYYSGRAIDGLKEKDLVGIPWMVAFALRARGWYLRAENIWNKPNPMVESILDRPTRAHEQIFLLGKSGAPLWWRHRDTRQWRTGGRPKADYRWHDHQEDVELEAEPMDGWRTEVMANGRKRWSRINLWRALDYYYDADAIAEECVTANEACWDPGTNGLGGGDRKTGRSTRRFPRPGNWSDEPGHHGNRSGNLERKQGLESYTNNHRGVSVPWQGYMKNRRSVWTIAPQPFSGAHFATFPEDLAELCIRAGCPEGGTVLDPFGGAGTVLLVAAKLNRKAVIVEIKAEYAQIALQRNKDEIPLFVADLAIVDAEDAAASLASSSREHLAIIMDREEK